MRRLVLILPLLLAGCCVPVPREIYDIRAVTPIKGWTVERSHGGCGISYYEFHATYPDGTRVDVQSIMDLSEQSAAGPHSVAISIRIIPAPGKSFMIHHDTAAYSLNDGKFVLVSHQSYTDFTVNFASADQWWDYDIGDQVSQPHVLQFLLPEITVDGVTEERLVVELTSTKVVSLECWC